MSKENSMGEKSIRVRTEFLGVFAIILLLLSIAMSVSGLWLGVWLLYPAWATGFVGAMMLAVFGARIGIQFTFFGRKL